MRGDIKVVGKARWEVFANTDADVGGWYSYVEDDLHYLGGDLHKTKAKAEEHGRKIAEAANGRQE
jgi:hypothetical protein